MNKKTMAIARAAGVIGATAALVVGVTFAALTSNSVTLSNNSFATATASLKVWDPTLGTPAYVLTAPGFNFANLVPGTQSAPFTFWLKNDGGVAMNITGLGSGGTSSGVNLALVDVEVMNLTAGGTQTFTMAALLDATPDLLPGGDLTAGEEDQYQVKVTIQPAAVTGSSATMSGVTWTFTGTQTP